MTRRRALAWCLLLSNGAGLVVTFSLWLNGAISDRTMIGITLALSWIAPMLTAINTLFLASDSEGSD